MAEPVIVPGGVKGKPPFEMGVDNFDDWMEYYNSERYQWQLAKLSPNEYYGYITTGIYPLEGIINERK